MRDGRNEALLASGRCGLISTTVSSLPQTPGAGRNQGRTKGVGAMTDGRFSLLTDAELVLCRSTALALLETWPTAILGLGPLGDIAYANPTCAGMLGYPDRRTLTR